ncbi:MAG: hypothetical protein DMF73_16215, partial [Acidobacteria bacterium]
GGFKRYNVNHGVTLIGWDDRLAAWLIKNSWGKGWGEWAGPGLSVERGYGLVAYGSNNIGLAAAWVVARPLPFIKTSQAWLDSKTIVEEK